MITIQELVDTYEKNSNDELLTMYASAGDYTNEAREALQVVIDKRGGLEALRAAAAGKRALAIEELRIRNDAEAMVKRGQADPAIIKQGIVSTVFSAQEVSDMVDDAIRSVHFEREDRTIKPRTILGSAFGGLIGGTLGGAIWGLAMIQTKHLMPIIGLGVFILNYALVRYFTRQSGKNNVVLVASLLFTLYAFGIGILVLYLFAQC